MHIISSVELRDMQAFAAVSAAFAKRIMDGAQAQMQANQQSLPPSEVAMVSIATSLSVIAAVAIKQLEQMEKNGGQKETRLDTQGIELGGSNIGERDK